MPRRVVPPYATPPAGAVSVKDWSIVADTPSVGVEDDRLNGWDHTVDLSVTVTAQVDPLTLATACQLGPESTFALVLSWHATGSGLRGEVAAAPLHDDTPVHVGGNLHGASLGGRLRLTASVVLDKAQEPGAVAPTVPGSVLVREQRSWLLEGVGDRFPVERVDFRAAGIRDPDAAWVVRWDHRDPEWDAHAAVRLQLNTRHPLVDEFVNPTGEHSGLLHSVMRRDIMRQLVLTALELDGFVIDPLGWHEGSLGQALSVVLSSLFPDASIEEIRSLLRDDPAGFDAVLQGGARFLLDGATP